MEGIPSVSSVSSGGSRRVMDDRNTVYEGFFGTEAAVKRIRHHKASPLCLEILTQAELCAERVTLRDMEGRQYDGGTLSKTIDVHY